jgi:hypothetical protein
MRKGLTSTTLLNAQMLYKQRNANLFEGESPSTA